MQSLRISLSLLILLLTFGAGTLAHPAPSQDLETLAAQFRSAASSKDSAKRTAALDALVALGDPGAVATLSAEYGKVSVKVREGQDDAYRAKYALDRIEDLIRTMELRLERDSSLDQAVKNQRNKRDDLRRKYEKAQGKVATWSPWRDEIGVGTAKLFEGLAKGKRKKAEKEVWEQATEATNLKDRISATEFLGFVGADGTALAMQKQYFELIAKRGRSKKQMRKMEADVKKMEQRLQENAVRNQGMRDPALDQQYERAKQESSRLRKEITLEGYLCDACIEAGGRALAREQGKALDKSLASLVKALKKSKDSSYVGLLEMLARAEVEPVQVRLRAILETEKEPLGKATMLEALAAAGDQSVLDPIVSTYLQDEAWIVRASAADALATLRDKKGIGPLIQRLAVEDEGRLRTDISKALKSLTGKDYRTNATLWQRWWKDAEKDFVIPELGTAIEASANAEETVGVTFFGIRTESQRVLFVLDLSGSMEFSMVPRKNPDDDLGRGREPDRPKEGEQSRLQAAKQDLKKAMGGLQDDAVFNVIFYASDVWSWQDDLVKMDPDTRSEITEVVDELEAVGGTNIYGALESAFAMAGVKEGKEWTKPLVDTIFLLSDGKPSVGISVDPDEILAMVREANQNAGITIHTIGLSGAQDAYLLRSLAEQNGGDYAAR